MQFGTAILIGVLLAQLGLPTELMSVYEALLFIASLYCFFWIVGGQNALLQIFPKLDLASQKRALFNVWALFSGLGALTAGLLFLSKNFVATYLTSFDELPHLDLLALFLLFNCPTFLIQIFYLLLGKFREIVVFGAISFGLQLLVVILPIYFGFTLRETMLGLVAWAVFKYLWGMVVLVKNADWKVDSSFLKIYLPLVLPLLLFAFIGKGSEYISGLVVTSLFEDDKAFAVFRYGAREFPLAVLMVGALATSLLPEVSENLEAGLARIKNTTRRLSNWLYPLSVLSMLVSPIVFPIFFNPDFKESAWIFNIFTLLLVSRILLPQVVVMAKQKNYFLTFSALVEMAVLLALSWWWGSVFGLVGVAWAAVFAFAVDRIMLILFCWKKLGIAPGRYIHWPSYFGWNLLLIIGFFISLNL